MKRIIITLSLVSAIGFVSCGSEETKTKEKKSSPFCDCVDLMKQRSAEIEAALDAESEEKIIDQWVEKTIECNKLMAKEGKDMGAAIRACE